VSNRDSTASDSSARLPIELRDEAGAIYQQLARILRYQLIRGDFHPGDKLPSTRDFALQHRVNPNTVVQTYRELDRQGLTERRRGLGTFVREDVDLEGLRESALRELAGACVSDLRLLGLSKAQILRAVKEVLN
jgi:GntR family transcriptional regulator